MKKTLLLIGYLFLFYLTSHSNDHIEMRSLYDYKTLIISNINNKNRSVQDWVQEKNDLKTCIDVVTQILLTSPTYLEKTRDLNKAVVKNGGTSIGITLEGSPHPESDHAQEYSNTYDFNLHETYPDRVTVIERFTFNPEDKQLFLVNVIDDKLKPIDFDRSLLIKLVILPGSPGSRFSSYNFKIYISFNQSLP